MIILLFVCIYFRIFSKKKKKWLNILGRRILVSLLRHKTFHISHILYYLYAYILYLFVFYSLKISAIKFYARYDVEDNILFILQLFKITNTSLDSVK